MKLAIVIVAVIIGLFFVQPTQGASKGRKQTQTPVQSVIQEAIQTPALSPVVSFGYKGLTRIESPTLEQAREFLNWRIDAKPIYRLDGSIIKGFSEFQSSKGHTLHVGNDTYKPFQPLNVFNAVEKSIRESGHTYSLKDIGSFDEDRRVFGQFKLDEGEFTVNGKPYHGFLTFTKGNDESLPLLVYLTLVCIVCANTLALAIQMGQEAAKSGEGIKDKQTKNSDKKALTLVERIKEVLKLQKTAQEALNAMAQSKITLSDAERAFLGLMKIEELAQKGKLDDTKTGKTRLGGRLDDYKAALQHGLGSQGELTRESWLNAVTDIGTHGDKTSTRFDAGKQWISSEFGTERKRKAMAFHYASDDSRFTSLVQTGDVVMAQLLNRPMVVPDLKDGGAEFARLLAK